MDILTSTFHESPKDVAKTDSIYTKSGQINYLLENKATDLPSWRKKRRSRLSKLYVKKDSYVDSSDMPFHPKNDEEADFLHTNIVSEFFFSTISQKALEDIINAFEKIEVSRDEVIIRQGDDGDSFYIIETGLVRYEVNGNEVGLGGPGERFGALSLLYNRPRAASCIANESCKLWRVTRRIFMHIVSQSEKKNFHKKKVILRRVPFLSQLDDEFLDKFVESSVEQSFSKDTVIMSKGDEGGEFYVLTKVKVLVHNIGCEESKCKDVELGPGSYFGETSIITQGKRNASVTAIEDCEVLSFSAKFCESLKICLREIIISSNYRRWLTDIFHQNKNLKTTHIKTLSTMIREVSLKSKTFIQDVESMPKRGIYFVLDGIVESESIGKSELKKIGDFFGNHTLYSDQFFIKAKVIEDCKLGVLNAKDIESVCSNLVELRSTLIPLQLKESMNNSFPYNDLKIQRVIGQGAFGKVWLTSSSNGDKNNSYFALKEMSKRRMIDEDYIPMIKREVEVLSSLDHPFVIKMSNVYQNGSSIFILFPLMQGGELLSLLEDYNSFSEKATKFYGAIILEALFYLSTKNLVYRDLKPENILINSDGYCVLVDFGFAKQVIGKTFTMCGTPMYMAPETILSEGQNCGVDKWAWGIILYEMCVGEHPFYDEEEHLEMNRLFRRICRGDFYIPDDVEISEDLEDLLSRVLVVKRNERIGYMKGWDEIKEHFWYKDYDFSALLLKQHEAPWKPDPFDMENLVTIKKSDSQLSLSDYDAVQDISTNEQEMFQCFGEYYV